MRKVKLRPVHTGAVALKPQLAVVLASYINQLSM